MIKFKKQQADQHGEFPEDAFGAFMCFMHRKSGAQARAGVGVFITVAEAAHEQIMTVTEAKEFRKVLGKLIERAENINREGH